MVANKAVTYVLVGVVAAGAGFGGGYLFRNYQLGQTRTQFARQFGAGAGSAGGRFLTNGTGTPRASGGQVLRMGGRPVSGDVIAADANSITVKMPDGSSRIVLLSPSTQITTATDVTRDKLATGVRVTVFGTDNSDGSVSATSVQLASPSTSSGPSAAASISPAPTQ